MSSLPFRDPKRAPKRAAWFRYTDTASVGIEMVIAVAIGAFAGMWLERNVTHWSPWTTLLGVGIGLGAAVKAIVRTARTYKQQLAAEREVPDRAGSDDEGATSEDG